MKETSYTYNVLIVLAFVMTMLFGTVPASAQTSYWTDKGNYNATGFSGDGTEASPYEIWTAEDLARLAYDVNYDNKRYENVYFVQRADVDLSEHLWEPIGRDASKTFMGHYAGQGHKITNMTINETYLNNYPSAEKSAVPGYGLFGSVNGHSSYASYTPVIQNVVLVSPSITINTAGFNKYTRIGLLVGALGNNSTLKNCNVQGGKIVINNLNGLTASANMFIGGAIGDCAPGFAGYSTNSVPVTIKNISVDADITVTPTSTTSNVGNYQYNAAGIVGRMRYSRGPLDNCFYTGKIDAPQFMVSPSYGAIRNTNSTVTADNYAGKFYDASEKNGTKVYFGNYQVMYKGNYRTITPNNSGGYDFSPAEGTVSTLTKSDPASTPAGLSVWTFGSCTGTFTSDMYRTQGVNSCDKYVSSSTTFSYSNLVDEFNSGISSDNIMRYHWSNHEGKLLLERLDDATLTYNDVANTLTLDFTAPTGAKSVTYHWRRGAEEVHSGTTDADKTFKLPNKTLTDIIWNAYVSYEIGTKTYYSSIPEYTQVATATMPTVTLTGSRMNNNLTLTPTLNNPDELVFDGEATYHWTKDGVEYSGSVVGITAFTPENVEWQVYATFTHEGTTYQTDPVTHTQEPPKMTYEVNDDGTNLTFTLGFDVYGGALTDVKYVWDVYNYDAEGNPQPDTKTVLDSSTHSVPSLSFEEKVWHAYVTYKYESQDYQTASERYLQRATALPTLSVSKDPSSGTQLVMVASLDPNYSGVIPTYHWSKNGEEQPGNEVTRTVPHAFDTQLWRCWATFVYNDKTYTTNDDTYTYYSTLGELHFKAEKQPNGNILATLQEASAIASTVTIEYAWRDSQGHNGTGTIFNSSEHPNTLWVEFTATITDNNSHSNKLVKFAYYNFDIDHNVVYIKYNGGGTDSNDGRTPQTPVATWKKAYSLLDNDGWDKNIIVIVKETGGTKNMVITEADAAGKAATITGTWPWDASIADKNDWGWITVNSNNSTNGGTRIGASTRFQNVIFRGTGSSQNRMSCYLHSVIFGTGIQMRNFGDLLESEGATTGRRAPQFHLNLYGDQLASDVFPQGKNDVMEVVINSGQFGRILASRIAGTKATTTYIIGRHNNPMKVKITIDIKDKDNNRKGADASGNVVEYADDIAYLAAGLTQGMMYGDIEMNINSGCIATLVAASQGNALKMNDLKLPVSSFCGRTTVNINGHSNEDVVIQKYFGGCQGRVYGSDGICDAYFYGQSTLNITYGTIESNVFASSAGISGLRSADPDYFTKGWYTPDQRIPYPAASGNGYAYGVDYLPFNKDKQIVIMTTANNEKIDLSNTEIVFNIKGGVLNNIYGGSYGYSDVLTTLYAPAHAGRLFGNTSVNISGGTISGNVYGGGEGSAVYYNDAPVTSGQITRTKSEFTDVAQVYGNTNINITGKPTINGNIYGGGGGVASASTATDDTEFRDIAKVYGTTNVTIDADPEWEYRGNIYGGGSMGAIEGSTTVTIKSGTILGNVFGGSKGEPGHADKAKVTGATKVLIGE